MQTTIMATSVTVTAADVCAARAECAALDADCAQLKVLWLAVDAAESAGPNWRRGDVAWSIWQARVIEWIHAVERLERLSAEVCDVVAGRLHAELSAHVPVVMAEGEGGLYLTIGVVRLCAAVEGGLFVLGEVEGGECRILQPDEFSIRKYRAEGVSKSVRAYVRRKLRKLAGV